MRCSGGLLAWLMFLASSRRAGLLLAPSTAKLFFELSIPARSTRCSLAARSAPCGLSSRTWTVKTACLEGVKGGV